ncbi:unnamed protein product [Alopecurus aequalis]
MEQSNGSDLPSDLLELIAHKCRDAIVGLAAFRSVCRTWRTAVGPAPRLLVPAPPRAGSDSEHALVFPLSSGWSIIVDARDTSCHLSHLATGTTAALPKIKAVSDGRDITHREYVHYNDDESARGCRWGPRDKIRTVRPNIWIFRRYIDFADCLRFAVHVPPAPGTAAAAEGMMVIMYHVLQGRTGMVFCRPGDAAWTMVQKSPGRTLPVWDKGYFDFAYHDGKMYGLETNGIMEVFDATTLGFLHLVKPPPDTPNLANKMYGSRTDNGEFEYVHLVALPTTLILVRTKVWQGNKYSQPVAFAVFELRSAPDGLSWHKVTSAGNYELYLDGYKATFMENRAKNGTRIYYVHDKNTVATTQAYCYNMQDNKFECLYRSPEDSHQCSTKPSWFVP